MARRPGPVPSGKTETILARVSPSTKTALKLAADENVVSLSAEIEDRLRSTLNFDLAKGENARPDMSTLLGALRLVVEEVEDATGRPWHGDQFTRALTADALGWLLRLVPPDTDASLPPKTYLQQFEVSIGRAVQTLRQETAGQAIERGQGRFFAENVLSRMIRNLPQNETGAAFGRIYPHERTIGTELVSLFPELTAQEQDRS